MNKWILLHTVMYGLLVVALIIAIALYNFCLAQNEKLIQLSNKKAEAYNASLEVSDKVSEMYDSCVARSDSYDFKLAYEDLKKLIAKRESHISQVNSLQVSDERK